MGETTWKKNDIDVNEGRASWESSKQRRVKQAKKHITFYELDIGIDLAAHKCMGLLKMVCI